MTQTMNAKQLITRMTTMDAAAERKFNATSVAMVRERTDAVRALLTAGTSLAEIYNAVVEMRGWGCFGSLQAMTWLDRQLDKLTSDLEPADVALANAVVAASIANDLMAAV